MGKTKPDVPGAGGAAEAHAKIADNSSKRTDLTDDEMRKLFIDHRGTVAAAEGKVAAAKKILDEALTAAKADGFTKKDFKVAVDLTELGGEAKLKKEIEARLRVAKFLGLPLGSQLGLFGEPDRTPSVDRAFDEGKQASMEGKSAKPPYAPELPQYKAWLDGHAEDQSRQMGNIKRDDKPAQPKL